MQKFPGGVVSTDGSTGIVHLAGKELLAVELATGAILWRRTSLARPVAASARHLVVLSIEPSLALGVHELASGELKAVVEDAALPDWLVDLGSRPEALSFSAREDDDLLEVSWAARALHTGGAPPRRTQQPAGGSQGSLAIDLRAGRIVRSRIEDVQLDPLSDLPEPEHLVGERALSGEVGRGVVRGQQYVLRIEPREGGRQAVKLDALRPGGQEVLWETELGDVMPMQKPGPLRK